jgi:hypothetical protein
VNDFDNAAIQKESFAYKDLLGQDKWESFTLTFTSLTVVGATTYSGRFRRIGQGIEFQAQFSAATSVASTAGTTYLLLPVAALGVAGAAIMTDRTSNVAVGSCVIDVTNSRCYLPAQVASADVFNIYGSYEA